jgi:hypothetical protein
MINNPKTQVKFNQSGKTAFFQTLKSRIDKHFVAAGYSKHANAAMVVKTFPCLLFTWLHLLCYSSFNPCGQ